MHVLPRSSGQRPGRGATERSPQTRRATIELEPTKTYSFGRLPTCAVRIASPNVSRLQAEISWRHGNAVLIDHSSYGTLVGGKPIGEHQLVAGDEIQMGPFHCTYAEEPAVAGGGDVRQSTNPPGSGAMFVGLISGGGLGEYLQALEFNSKTGTLHVYGVGKGKNAWLAVRAGISLAAEADGRVDEEAVLALLRLEKGRFVFSREVAVAERRIAKNITGLLLEASRRADEGDRAEA